MSKKVERYIVRVLDASVKDNDFEIAIKELKEREVPFTKKGSKIYFETPTGSVEIVEGGKVVHELLGTVSLTEALSELDLSEDEANEVKEGYDMEDSSEEYEACQYKGKEWGVYAKRSKAFVVFGTPKQMKERAKQLNENEKLGNTKIKPRDGAINYKHSEDGMPSYGVDLREVDTEDENEWMQDMADQTVDLVEDANGEIADYGMDLANQSHVDYFGDEVQLVVEPGHYDGFTLNVVVDSEVPQEILDFAFGKMAEIAESVGLVKMEFGGWTGPVYLTDGNYKTIIISNLGDKDKNLKYVGTEFQVQVDPKASKLGTDDSVYEEVFLYAEKHPELFMYKNKELKSWEEFTKKDLEEALSLTFDYDKTKFNDADHEPYDEYTNSIEYVICRGKRYPTTTLTEVTDFIEGNRWSEDINRILEVMGYEEVLETLREPDWIKNHLTKQEFEDMMFEAGTNENAQSRLGDSKFTDANAEEIINLINEAGEKGRSWYWLEKRLPEEFKNLRNRHGSLFPVQQDWRGATDLVHLKKPKNLGLDINWDWLQDYKDMKNDLDVLYEKYGGKDWYSFQKAIDEVIESEDSISKRTNLESDKSRFRQLMNGITDLADKSGIKRVSGFWYGDFYKKDFVFDKNKYIKELNESYDNRRHKENQRKPLLGAKGKTYITSKDDKVEPLTPDAEAYIRKIMRETTTEEIGEKQKRRGALRNERSWEEGFDWQNDPLLAWRKERKQLRFLLKKLNELESKGTIGGISYQSPRSAVKYVKNGSYNSRGRYVGYGKGGYELTGGMTDPDTRVLGVDEEAQKPLAQAISKAFSARTVADLRSALVKALESIELLPDDSSKITEAKQKIITFMEDVKNKLQERKEGRTRKLPDSSQRRESRREDIATPYIYLFPEGMTFEDLREARNFGLEYIGDNIFEGNRSYVLQGNKRTLKKYADEYLGYELHPDYLYRKDEFAGTIK